MAVSASARDRFYRKIESLIGAEDAEFLMTALPPDGWDEVATSAEVRELGSGLRGEMAELRGDLRTEMAELRGGMAGLRGDLRTEMAGLRGDLRTEVAELGSALRTEMADLRTGTADLRNGMAELRADVRTDVGGIRTEIAGMRSEMVTRADLGELLRLHVDARIGAISRWWLVATMGMQAATIGGVVTAIRL